LGVSASSFKARDDLGERLRGALGGVVVGEDALRDGRERGLRRGIGVGPVVDLQAVGEGVDEGVHQAVELLHLLLMLLLRGVDGQPPRRRDGALRAVDAVVVVELDADADAIPARGLDAREVDLVPAVDAFARNAGLVDALGVVGIGLQRQQNGRLGEAVVVAALELDPDGPQIGDLAVGGGQLQRDAGGLVGLEPQLALDGLGLRLAVLGDHHEAPLAAGGDRPAAGAVARVREREGRLHRGAVRARAGLHDRQRPGGRERRGADLHDRALRGLEIPRGVGHDAIGTLHVGRVDQREFEVADQRTHEARALGRAGGQERPEAPVQPRGADEAEQKPERRDAERDVQRPLRGQKRGLRREIDLGQPVLDLSRQPGHQLGRLLPGGVPLARELHRGDEAIFQVRQAALEVAGHGGVVPRAPPGSPQKAPQERPRAEREQRPREEAERAATGEARGERDENEEPGAEPRRAPEKRLHEGAPAQPAAGERERVVDALEIDGAVGHGARRFTTGRRGTSSSSPNP
jgi:hypothetical protein